MTIFYTNTGSFDKLEVTGELVISGSAQSVTRIAPTASVGLLLVSGSATNRINFASTLPTTPSIVSNGTDLTLNAAGTVSLKGGVTVDNDGFVTIAPVIGDLSSVGSSFGGPYDLGVSSAAWNNLFVNNILANRAISASFISASTALTASNVQLNNLTDTTAANKVLVLNTATNRIFTTASVGGASTPTFPFSGSAVITGSLVLSSSNNNSPVIISGSTNSFFELEVVNFNAGNNASSDIVVSSNNTTELGNYIDLGINSTTFNGPLVGGASDGYLYLTSSVGELDIGHAAPGANSNIRLFTGGPNSTANTRVFISASGNVGIGTTTNLRNTLTVNGSVSASSVTGSLTGSFAGAITHFSPSTVKLTVGTTAPASPAVNDLWVDTN